MDDESSKSNVLSEINNLTSQFKSVMLLKLAETFADYLSKTDHMSVSASDLGLTYPAFMVRGGLFCYDPKIILFGANKVKDLEYGRKAVVKIKRADSIVVAYTNFKNERVVRDLVGTEARYFQHEVDKLSGMDWRTRATQKDQIDAIKRVLH